MWLSLLLIVPLAGMVVILFLDRERHVQAIRGVAVAASALVLAWSIACAFAYSLGVGEREHALVMPAASAGSAAHGAVSSMTMRLEYQAPWIPSLGITYHLGVDGLSLPLIILTTGLTFLSVIYSLRIQERVKEYMAFFLLLEVGMLGVFVALDFFLFYVFWEIGLVPMFFLIGIWGGPRREYAAIKFFLYTLVGSLAMLLALLALYFTAQPHTFDILDLIRQNPMNPLTRAPLVGSLVFWGLFLGFAIKVPLFPFHTWLPDAHVEAPTAGSVILAGVLLKLGTYGFVRVSLPLLPQQCAQYADWIAALALISIIYGALCAMAQQDLKKLIAYSSVNHMGFVMLGVAAAAGSAGIRSLTGGPTIVSRATALNGATLQMVAHGIITGALFFLVGVIYDRAHTRLLDQFGGLAKQMPLYFGIMTVAALASLGLPGMAGFVAEFSVFVGSFASFPVHTILAAIGVIVTAAYLLWMLQRLFLGPLNERWKHLTDMDWGEVFALAPLVAAMLVIGLYPYPLMQVINGPMTAIVQWVTAVGGG